jgi:putative CocE/NonD family hydrolase
LSEIAGRSLRLPRPRTRDVLVERDLPATMDDGVVLLADRYVARDEADPSVARRPPTVLVRTPYGRHGFFGFVYGRLLAERGLQVVVQSVRGTFGSGGSFAPFDERADGLATLRWLGEQPWCEGPIGMIGSSYMGLTQWAVAGVADGAIGALSPSITASNFHGQAYGGGSLSLETAFSWVMIIAAQERRLAPLRLILGLRRRLPRAVDELPLAEVDALLAGEEIPWFREWFEVRSPEDPYWTTRDFSADVRGVTAPVQLIGGWQDIFLPWLVEDYRALREAGREAQLVIGPWAHTSPGLLASSTREGLAWLRAHLLGDRRLLSPARVRVWVGGENRWRELPDWPPPGTRPWRLRLAAGGRLLPEDEAGPADAEPRASSDRFTYDPARPTPALGGPVLLAREPVVDNRPLEARDDVLVYTTDPLPQAVEALGPVEADVHVRTSSPYADVFVRVCDVHEDGRSLNVCDALIRLDDAGPPAGEDGVRRVRFSLWPTAHRFAAGHRVRVLVAGGAHPRYARNTGTGEEPHTGTRLLAVEHEVHHGERHPSAVELTVA